MIRNVLSAHALQSNRFTSMPAEPPKSPEIESFLIRPSTGLVSVPNGGSPALSEIINRSLVHIQTSKTLGRLHRIGDHELQWPDYQLVSIWAEQLNVPPAEVLMNLLKNKSKSYHDFKTTVVDGQFLNLFVSPKLKGITGLPEIRGLIVEKLSLELFDQQVGWGVGQLTKLDLSLVPNLKVLLCRFNQLTELDLSPTPNLTVLSCGFNQLPRLDLSSIPNLTELWCEENQLTELDLTPVPNLRSLDCHDNKLTNLDLVPVPNIESLYCVENQLTKLDISPIKRLINSLWDNSVNLIHRADQNISRGTFCSSVLSS